MDTSAFAASAFGSLPYFSPLMMVNTSGVCATTRLLQCRFLGISMNDISRKFDRPPENSPDLDEEAFMSRKKVLSQMANTGLDYTPILYRYEIIRGGARRQRDWGDVVFIDPTTMRFLLVMVFPRPCKCSGCGSYSHEDYDELTKYQASRLFSLARYLYHDQNKPKWVRATYVTPDDGYKINPDFLNNLEGLPTNTAGKIFQITNDNFVPSLLESELQRIDNLRAQDEYNKPIPSQVRRLVLGGKETRPRVSSAWKQKNPRQCAYCEEVKEQELKRCGRCKLIFYCSPECQKAAWPSHKLVCKTGQQ